MCQVLQNKSVEDLARLVKEYAGSVQRNLDNPHVAHDYMSDLSSKSNKFPNVTDYLTYGRKRGITLFLLSQGYYEISKTLRNQMTYILLFTLPQMRDVKAILSQFDTQDKILQDIYEDATKEHLSFLKINTKKVDPNKRFSKGFTKFYTIE